MVLTYAEESTGDQGNEHETNIKIDETDEMIRSRERTNFEENLRNKGLNMELEPSAVCLIFSCLINLSQE